MTDEQNASTRSIPSVDVVQQIAIEWTQRKLTQFRDLAAQRGMTVSDEQLQSFAPQLRPKFVEFALQDIPTGLGWSDFDTRRALRASGFQDLVENPSGTEREYDHAVRKQRLAEAKAALEKREEIVRTEAQAQAKEFLPKKSDSFLGRMFKAVSAEDPIKAVTAPAAQELLMDNADRAFRQGGATVSAVASLLHDWESLKKRTSANPMELAKIADEFDTQVQAIKYRTDDIVGVAELVELGVPHWLADIMMQELTDPLMLITGTRPLVVDAAVLASRATFGAARGVTRLMRAGAMRLEPLSGEVLDTMVKAEIANAEKSLGLKPNLAEVNFKTLGEDLKAAEGPRRTMLAGLSKALEGRKKASPDTFIHTADKEIAGIAQELIDAGQPGMAEDMLHIRAAMIGNETELAKLQTYYLNKLEGIDPQAVRSMSIKTTFYNPKTQGVIEIDGGLLSKALQNPEKKIFTQGGKVRKTKEMERIRAIYPDVEIDDLKGLIPLGDTGAINNARIALKEYERTHTDEMVQGVKNMQSTFTKAYEPAKFQMETTPVFAAGYQAEQSMNAIHEVNMLRLHRALGADVRAVRVDAVGNKVHGVAQTLIDNKHPLMQPNPAVLSAERARVAARKAIEPFTAKNLSVSERVKLAFDFRRPDQVRLQTRDFAHQILKSMAPNDKKFAGSMARERARLGLPNEIVVSPEAERAAVGIKALFDEAKEQALRWGIIDPGTVLNEYLPRIAVHLDSGKNLDKAINLVKKSISNDPLKARISDPIFAMLRTSEKVDELINDPVRLFEIYDKQLQRQIFLKPVVDDMVKIATSESSGLLDRQRELILNYAHHLSGGRTNLERIIEAEIRTKGITLDGAKAAEQKNELRRETIEGAYVNSLVSEAKRNMWARWASRQVASMSYVKFLGADLAAATRNAFQPVLTAPFLGGVGSAERYLVRGAKRAHVDEEMIKAYWESEAKFGWSSRYLSHLDDEFSTALPDIMPEGFLRFSMGWYHGMDTTNRMTTYAAGMSFIEDQIQLIKAGKPSTWRRSMGGFDVSERATMTKLMRDGNYDAAKTFWAEAVVNNSQWLYGLRNKTAWAQDHRVRASLLMFQSWNQNAMAVNRRAAQFGADGVVTAKGLGGAAKMSENAMKYIAPYMLIGVGATYAGSQVGADLSGMFFPSLSNLPGGKDLKAGLGVDAETKVVVPIPKFITGTAEFATSVPYVAQWVANTGSNAWRVITSGDDEEKRATAYQEMFRASPLSLPETYGPALSQFGAELGVDEDPELREGIFDQVVGGLLNAHNPDGQGSMSGFKKLSGEQKFLWEILNQ